MATNIGDRPFIDLTTSDVARLVNHLPMDRITDLGAFHDQSLFREAVDSVRESVWGRTKPVLAVTGRLA
ncbi:hypothetical protein [Nonomuraea sp. NPDC050643]|uniref:hypothetical protein n=1 Tax=Nonomuraea sp. NPDC050643 TaxID=3155660 RepID=UPI0033D8CDD8